MAPVNHVIILPLYLWTNYDNMNKSIIIELGNLIMCAM